LVSNKLSYLIISSEFPPGPGGIGQHAASFAVALCSYGQVHVLANQDYADANEVKEFNSALPPQIQLHTFALRSGTFTSLKRMQQAIALTKQIKPTRVFVTGRFPLWVGAVLKLRFPHLRVDGFAHGTEVSKDGGLLGVLTHRAAKKLNHIYAVSHFTAKFLIDDGVTNVSVVPNGLDATFYAARAQVKSLFPWRGSPRLLTVGNLTPRKGQHRVIKALPQLLQKFPAAHYHMVGLPSTQTQLAQLADGLGVSRAITFHGRLPAKTDVQRAYASANIFIMLSENQPNGDVEGFGIAILEANAMGIPAIGASGCGIEDAISPNSGILVDGDNPEEIALAVEKIMANYDAYSQGARQWAEQHNWEELVKDLVVFSPDSYRDES